MTVDLQRPPVRRGFFRASALTSVAAMAAVLSGLALDLALALSFGVGASTDAFFVAARIPVGVVMVLLSGASLGLVPVFSRVRELQGNRAADAVTTSVLALALGGGLVVAGLVALAAKPVVRLLAPGLDDAALTQAATLLGILALVMPLTGLAEVLRSVANSLDSFAVPAAANVALNLVAAAVIVIGATHGIVAAAWAYVAGGLARIAVLLIWNVYLGWQPVWRSDGFGGLRDTQAINALRLSARPSAGAGLAPVVRIVEGIFASFLPSGSITILNYGYRLIFAIGGSVVFRSILGVLLPGLTRATTAGDLAAERRLTRQGVRAVVVLGGLLTAGFVGLGQPAAQVVFGRGRVDPQQAVILGGVLAALSLCLVAEGVQRALQQPFYARLDTRTPLRNSLLGAGVNIALIPALALPFAPGTGALFGIVAAFVISDWVAAFDAWRRWHRLTSDHLALSRLAAGVLLGAGVGAVVGWGLRSWWGLPGDADMLGVGLLAMAGAAVTASFFLVVALADPQIRRIGRRGARKELPVTAGVTETSFSNSAGRHRDPVIRPSLTAWLTVLAVSAGGIAALLLPSFAGWLDTPTAPLLLWLFPLLVGVGAFLAALAGARYAHFVLAVLPVRPALDFYNSGGIGFGTLLGASFLCLSMVWMAAQLAHRRALFTGYPLTTGATALAVSGLLSTVLGSRPATSLPELLRLTSVLMMFVILERLMRQPGFPSRTVVAVAVSIVVPMIVGLRQLIDLGLSGQGRQEIDNRVNATFSHPNSLAMFLALLVVALVALYPVLGRWKPLAIVAGLLMSFLLLGTFTRVAWIGAAFGVLVVAWMIRRRLALVALAVVAAISLTPPVTGRFQDILHPDTATYNTFQNENSLEWRIGHWQRALDASATRRVTGLGPGIVEADSVGHKPMHNDYLRALVEFGGVGLAAYLFFIGTMIYVVVLAQRRARTTIERTIAVAAAGTLGVELVMALTDNLISQSVVLWYLAPTIAAASAIAHRRAPGRVPIPTPELVS